MLLKITSFFFPIFSSNISQLLIIIYNNLNLNVIENVFQLFFNKNVHNPTTEGQEVLRRYNFLHEKPGIANER